MNTQSSLVPSHRSMPSTAMTGRSTSHKKLAQRTAMKQPSLPAKARSRRPAQQWSTLKFALAAGSIAATLLGTQLIAAKDQAAAVAQALPAPLLSDMTARQLFNSGTNTGGS